jgi:hypothetical protein
VMLPLIARRSPRNDLVPARRRFPGKESSDVLQCLPRWDTNFLAAVELGYNEMVRVRYSLTSFTDSSKLILLTNM